jgi:hypothetical protein
MSKQNKTPFELWMEWRPHRLHVKDDMCKIAQVMCDDIGLKNPKDFQIKGNEMRFKHVTDLAFMRVNLNE